MGTPAASVRTRLLISDGHKYVGTRNVLTVGNASYFWVKSISSSKAACSRNGRIRACADQLSPMREAGSVKLGGNTR